MHRYCIDAVISLQIDFIRLADITSGMTEPCVMDIKIGQRTWDPLATIDKIQMEEVRPLRHLAESRNA